MITMSGTWDMLMELLRGGKVPPLCLPSTVPYFVSRLVFAVIAVDSFSNQFPTRVFTLKILIWSYVYRYRDM